MKTRLNTNTQTPSLIALLISLALVPLGGSGMPQRESTTEVEKLVTQLRDPALRETNPQRVCEAIDRLGEMKAVAAIDDLVQLLRFKRTFSLEDDQIIQEIHAIGPAERYPAVNALILIGRPALPALVKTIKEHKISSLESDNAGYAVFEIFYKKLEDAATYLREAAVEASSRTEVRRLRHASEKIEEVLRVVRQP